MRLFKENPRVYMTVKAKPTYRKKKEENKANTQAETKFTPSRLYWENMPPDPTQKQRNQSNSSTLNAKNPQRETTKNLPSMVTNSVMERNFLWLGVYHNRQLDTRNQSLPNMQEKPNI